MPQPTLGDSHVDAILTMMSIGWMQDQTNFVADTVFPALPVNFKSDLYFKYNRGDFFRDEMQLRADGDPAAGGGYTLATGNYVCEVWSLLKKIGDQQRRNSDAPLNPDKDAVDYLTLKGYINRERQWASTYFKTGVWGYERAGQATADSTHVVYWNRSGSDPIADVLDAKLSILQTTGLEPNVLVLGPKTKRALKRNAVITDLLKYGQTGPGPVKVTDQDLAALFEVEKVVTMKGIYTTSAKNLNNDSDTLPDTFDFIGGKHAMLAYAAPSVGIGVPTAGVTFNWKFGPGAEGSGGTGAGWRIKKYRWEVNSADHVEIDSAYGFGLVSEWLGAFFNSVVE